MKLAGIAAQCIMKRRSGGEPGGHDALRSLNGIVAGVHAAGRGLGFRTRLGTVPRAVIRRVPGMRTVAACIALDRLAASVTAEHQQVAAALAAAMQAADGAAVEAILSTALHPPDRRAEKVLSRRHGFLCICNPKVASRSIIKALLAADPGAELITGRTLDEITAARPEARDYYTFAFIRHPSRRAFSFWADKHVKLAGRPEAARHFIEPYYGVRRGMTFAELCRWLNTPFGSDAFADRHWLSQHRQIRLPDGRLPDFIGHHERLDVDWAALASRLGLPLPPLPRANAGGIMQPEAHLDGETDALLRRRYAADFRLGGYDA